MRSKMALFLVIMLSPFFIAAKVVNRVAIVGGGTAGLGLAASLRLVPSVKEVVLYEMKNDILQTTQGGGVQLTGGAKVLDNLNLLPKFKSLAEKFVGVNARDNNGKEIFALDIEEAISSSAASNLLIGKDGSKLCFSIMRHSLQELLYTEATSSTFKDYPKIVVKTNVSVIGFRENFESDEKISVQLKDGTQDIGFDLIFGADGARSTIRNCASLEKSLTGEEGSTYTGLRITYCVSEPDPECKLRPKTSRGNFNQWFGDGCYVLTASYGGNLGLQHMLACVYQEDPQKSAIKGENVDWLASDTSALECTQSENSDPKEVLKQRLHLAGLGDIGELLTLVEACDSEKIIDLGVRDRTIPLRSWLSPSGRAILLGDSAHHMAPFLGQGSNQALIDAYSLAMLVKKINEDATVLHTDNHELANVLIQKAMRTYESRRKVPTALLSSKSGILGKIECAQTPLGMWLRNTLFSVLSKLGVVQYVFLDGAKPTIVDSY